MSTSITVDHSLFAANLTMHAVLGLGLLGTVRSFESLCDWYDGSLTTASRQFISACHADARITTLLGIGLVLLSATTVIVAKTKGGNFIYLFVGNIALEAILLLDKAAITRSDFVVFLLPFLVFLILIQSLCVLRNLLRSNG